MAPYVGKPTSGSSRSRRVSQVTGARNDYRAAVNASRRAGIRPATMARARAAVRNAMEKKGMDTELTATGIDATTNTNSFISVLNLIPGGTSSWQRVGRKTHLKSVRILGRIQFNITPTFGTGVSNDTYVRCILVWDSQPSGAAIPAFDTIFGTTTALGLEACPLIQCPPRYDNMDRFRILRDWNVQATTPYLPAFGGAPSMIAQTPIDEYVKIPDLESVFSGQGVPITIAAISTGALYFLVRSVTDQANAIGDIAASAGVRYTG